ncbi:MAG: phage tail protein [Caulobacteraceae bacterium]
MGGSTHTTSQKYDGVIVQSSLKGIPIAKGWGTAQLGCNLVDYLDFSSKKVSTGKGGGAQPDFDYFATLVLAICLGPIAGIRTIYKDSAYFIAQGSGSKEVNGTTIVISAKTPVQAAGLTQLFLGQVFQAPWTYLQSNHPADALGYSGIAYAAAENYNLNTSATTPNFNFEVQFLVRGNVNGATVDDANPAEIMQDLLPDVPRWPGPSAIADLSVYQTYCYAQGLLLSPVADGGRQAGDLITEILTCSNSDCFISEGLFQVAPLGDTAITANGVTYTPNLTPIYSLTWDDILPSSEGQDPIQWDLKPEDQCYNYMTLGFLDRTQQYASDSIPAIDQAAFNTLGKNQGDGVSYDSICDAGVAATVAQLLVQRSANLRKTAQFLMSELFGLLDPMDLIEIPAPDGTPTLVRVNEVEEQEDGSIQFTVEEMLVGTAHTPLYTRQNGLGIPANFAIDPGDSAPPAIINPPLSLTNGAYEVWLATSGGPDWGGAVVWVSLDGEDFFQQGRVIQPGRYGVTTTDFAVGPDPDTSATLGVDLTASDGTLTTASQEAADAQTTLCVVGTELIAYSAATLTAANKYDLGTYIRRGLEGTTITDQPAGSLFMRLDNSVIPIPYAAGQVGKTVSVKLQSFNLYGNAFQDLDLCETYEFTAELNGAQVGDVSWTEIAGVPAVLVSYIDSGGTAVNVENIGPVPVPTVLQQIADAQAAAAQAIAQVTAAADAADDAAEAALASAIAQANLLFAANDQQYTVAGLPLGATLTQTQQTLDNQVATVALIGEVDPIGGGFVLNTATVKDENGVALATTFTQLAAATGSVAANLAQNYLTSTSTTQAIAAAQTTLQASINGVSATLTNNYLTSAQTTGAISAAESALQASINGVSATLTNSYLTSAQTTQAIAQAQTSLQASINGVSATLTNNYLTSAQTTQAIASTQATLQAGINGVSATVSEQAGALATVEGKTVAFLAFTAAAGDSSASVEIVADGSSGTILLTGNVVISGNVLVGGTVETSAIASGAITNTPFINDTTVQSLGSVGSAPVAVATLTETVSGGPVKIDVTIRLLNTDNSHDQQVIMVLLRDGNPLDEPFDLNIRENSSNFSGGYAQSTSAQFVDTGAAAGQHTWTVTAQVIGGNGSAVSKSSCRLIIQDLKTE